MEEISPQESEVLILLGASRAKRLMANLTEQRLLKRCKKSKTIQAGQDIYERLLISLVEAGYFTEANLDAARLHELLRERDLIDDAMARLAAGLHIPTHLGAALFYLIIGWVSAELRLSGVDHYDIVTCYSLGASEDGRLAQLIRSLVHIVIDNAVLRMNAEGCREDVDRDLQFMLHNGSAAGIYGRMKMLINCCALLYDGNANRIIVKTLAQEIPQLSRSRQIVFTRVLRHVTESIVGTQPGSNSQMTQQLNEKLWQLMAQGIEESGIRELAHDDSELVRAMERLGQQYDTRVIARVLSQDQRSYVHDQHDFRRNRDLTDALYAMRRHGIHFDMPETFNFAHGNLGTVLLDRFAV